jgi:hypothetical protein
MEGGGSVLISGAQLYADRRNSPWEMFFFVTDINVVDLRTQDGDFY